MQMSNNVLADHAEAINELKRAATAQADAIREMQQRIEALEHKAQPQPAAPENKNPLYRMGKNSKAFIRALWDKYKDQPVTIKGNKEFKALRFQHEIPHYGQLIEILEKRGFAVCEKTETNRLQSFILSARIFGNDQLSL